MREIHEKLSHFERIRWREILKDSGRQNHFIGIWLICQEAPRHLEDLGYDDLKRVVSLRLSAKEPVWGVMGEGILAVLWWDPEHTSIQSRSSLHEVFCGGRTARTVLLSSRFREER